MFTSKNSPMLQKKWDKNCWYTVDLSTSIYCTVFQFALHTKKGPHQEIPSFCEKTAEQTCKLGLACLKIREKYYVIESEYVW